MARAGFPPPRCARRRASRARRHWCEECIERDGGRHMARRGQGSSSAKRSSEDARTAADETMGGGSGGRGGGGRGAGPRNGGGARGGGKGGGGGGPGGTPRPPAPAARPGGEKQA